MSMRKRGVQAAATLGICLLWVVGSQGAGIKLEDVGISGSSNHARIVLDVNGSVTHRSFTLKNPDRIVVDLVGAVNGVKSPVPVGPICPVERLRVSQFKGAPEPVVRVVADLRRGVPYAVNVEGGNVVVVVGEPSDAAPTLGAGATAGEPAVTARVEDTSPDVFVMAPVPAASSGPVAPPSSTLASTTSNARSATTVVPEPDFDATPSIVAENAAPVVGDEPVVESTTSAPVAATPSQVAVTSTPAATPAGTTAGSGWSTTLEPEPAATPVAPMTTTSSAVVAPSTVDGEDTSPEAPPGGVELLPSGSDRRINLDIQSADILTVLRTLADYSGKNIIASKDVEGEVTARLYDTPWQDALNSILRAQGYGYVEENGILRVGILQKIRNEELEAAAAERKRDDLLPIETQVVKLQFADAEELKPALEDMMTQRGKLQVDSRTNALIVSDIPTSVEKIVAMAGDLDSRTPQVEITSRLVDVSLEDSKNLGINWSANNLQPPGSPVSISGGVSAPTTGAVSSLTIGSVQSWGQLQATLDALARNKKANVVSNPNITTVNNREAKILVGQKIPLIVADQAGNAITQLTKIGIQMAVIPHVNSDHTITMDMHTEVSELSAQATVQGGVIIQTSEADTRVLVDNGETAVIGGLVRDVKSHTYTGVPVLQDIPLVGWFFRNTNEETAKRELIIFVTPRMVEPGARMRSEPGGNG